MSEMLTEMVPGQEDSSDLELLQVRAFVLRSQEAAQGLGPSLRGTELRKPVSASCILGPSEASPWHFLLYSS